jgi:hypothetical protein
MINNLTQPNMQREVGKFIISGEAGRQKSRAKNIQPPRTARTVVCRQLD